LQVGATKYLRLAGYVIAPRECHLNQGSIARNGNRQVDEGAPIASMRDGGAMGASTLCHSVIRHLGGEARLKQLGLRVCANDETVVSVKLLHRNPQNVRSVIIKARLNGFLEVECFGPLPPSSFSAPLVGRVEQIVPENLGIVLGRMTGAVMFHRRH